MSALTNLARGRDCTIRTPVCNFMPDTTVACHVRMNGISGMGIKAPDQLCAWGCSACHQLVDTGHYEGTHMEKDDRDLLLLRGVIRTQYILIREGKIK